MNMNEQELIPKDKFDLDAVKRLSLARPEQVSVVATSLLEWVADMNWPVASEIIHVLPKFYKELLPSIEQILINQKKDTVWIYWIISRLLIQFPKESLVNLLPIIENGKAIWTTTGGYPFVNQDNTPTTVKDAQTGKVSIKIAGRDLLLSKATDVRLFCIDGRQVYSGHTDRITGLPYGIYVLRIEGTTLKIALR